MKRSITALVLGTLAQGCFAEHGGAWREPPPGDYDYELVVTARAPRPPPLLESSQDLAVRIHEDDAFNLASYRSVQQIAAGPQAQREPPAGNYDFEVIVTAPPPPALPAIESSVELAARISQDAALDFVPYAKYQAVVSE